MASTPEDRMPSDVRVVVLFTIPEAAALLRVTEGWLRKKVSARCVPHSRLGKHVRFTPEHLRAIAAAGEVVPVRSAPMSGQGLSSRSRHRPAAPHR